MIKKRRKMLGLTLEEAAHVCGVAKPILQVVEDEFITLPTIAHEIGLMFSLTPLQEEMLIPEYRRPHSPKYDPNEIKAAARFVDITPKYVEKGRVDKVRCEKTNAHATHYHNKLLDLYFWGDSELVEENRYQYRWDLHPIDEGITEIYVRIFEEDYYERYVNPMKSYHIEPEKGYEKRVRIINMQHEEYVEKCRVDQVRCKKTNAHATLYYDKLLGLYFWGDSELVEENRYQYRWDLHPIDGGATAIIRTDL